MRSMIGPRWTVHGELMPWVTKPAVFARCRKLAAIPIVKMNEGACLSTIPDGPKLCRYTQ